jgi:outer membrane protein assembly factor BamB
MKWSRQVSSAVGLVGAGWVLVGCTEGGGAGLPLWSERDSAGVVIVENRDDPALLEAGFALSPDPVLSIGTLDGEETQQLYQVSGGARLADGRVVIGNGGTHEVRVYDRTGWFSHAFGGEGEGPGEFGAVRVVGVRGNDSIVVHDRNLRRVSMIHATDGLVRSFAVGDEAGGYPMSQGMLADGTLVFGGGLAFSSDGGFPTGVVRMPSRYAAIDIAGRPVADFGEWPAFEMYAQTSAGRFTARSLPFAKGSSAASGGDRFYIGTSDTYEIHVFDGSGTKLRIIRLDRPLRSVTDGDVDQYVADEIEDADSPNERRQFEALIARMPIPDEMPAYGSLLVDALGYLWVQEYAGPRVRDPEWTVYDADGHVVGRVRTPDRVQLLEVGDDYVLGRLSDEFDVEYVQLWDLTRPEAS